MLNKSGSVHGFESIFGYGDSFGLFEAFSTSLPMILKIVLTFKNADSEKGC